MTVVKCLLQVELFLGTELIDDNLSLVDVAYIYLTKKVIICQVLSSLVSIQFAY